MVGYGLLIVQNFVNKKNSIFTFWQTFFCKLLTENQGEKTGINFSKRVRELGRSDYRGGLTFDARENLIFLSHYSASVASWMIHGKVKDLFSSPQVIQHQFSG
jgi:hypothetical protein